jgi:DNA-binding HxlR family transcriptional regulator
VTHHELLTLFNPSTLAVFGVVAKERTVRFKDLLDTLESIDLDRKRLRESLDQLEEAKLIKSQDAPEGVEDFKWYYITEEGLTVERELRRLEMVG